MKRINHLLPIALLLFGLLLVACNKDNVDTVIPDDPDYTPDTVQVNNLFRALDEGASALNMDCIQLPYPIEFKQESGATITVNSLAEYQTAMNLQGDDRLVDFVFPLLVTDLDGDLHEVNSNTELGIDFSSCLPTSGWEASTTSMGLLPAFLFEALCFDVVYPVNLEDGDGNAFIAESEEELIDLMASVDQLFFELPLTIENSEGDQLQLESINDFFLIVFNCDGIAPPVVGETFIIEGFACNTLQFPVDVVNGDGETITLEDENAYVSLILSGEELQLFYPFSLMNPDGEVLEINNEFDMVEAFQGCGIDIIIDTSDVCETPAHILLFWNDGTVLSGCGYEITYPVQLEAEGVAYEINNKSEYFELYGQYQNQIDLIEVLYPVNATDIAGDAFTFESDQDLCDLIAECDLCTNPTHNRLFLNQNIGSPSCIYEITFPVQLDVEGTVYDINDMDDYFDLLDQLGSDSYLIEVIYPVNATDVDGNPFTFESDEDVCDFIADCD